MSEVAQFEQQLSDAKFLVERRDMALKLSGNREFKKLILQEYLVDEAARLIGGSGDPNLNRIQQEDMVQMAKACGHLKRYLSVIVTMGNTAANDIPEIEAELVNVRAEEDVDNSPSSNNVVSMADKSIGGLD